MSGLRTYQEPLTDAELGYLVRKAQSDRKQFVQVYRILFLLSLLFSYLGAIYRRYDFGPESFSFLKFFVTFGILLSLSSISTWIVYRSSLHKIETDVREKQKTIEGHRINKKMFVPMKNTYHFFIDCPDKLSIQVNATDFGAYREGDEVFIEYASHSKEYFGYF
jgi:hypothetical protein